MKTKIEQTDHLQGKATAPVILLEYGDYQCPYCRKAYYIIKEIQKELGDKMSLVFRNFPLTDLHPHALNAALAAEAADKQGKFWQMHDMLFENQHFLENENLLDYARQLGLNIEQFKKDFSSEAVVAKVKKDYESGVNANIGGTPTFFVNGKPYEGNWTSPDFALDLKSLAE
ncbi:MAG: DsbA family protein [Prevotellaceae bacterium]|jgi:protein-disulfide isomerase|nr:DsbA family protein [Prevotellaceae bacterium]